MLADAAMPELVGQSIADAYPEVGADILAVENFQSRWISVTCGTNPETESGGVEALLRVQILHLLYRLRLL